MRHRREVQKTLAVRASHDEPGLRHGYTRGKSPCTYKSWMGKMRLSPFLLVSRRPRHLLAEVLPPFASVFVPSTPPSLSWTLSSVHSNPTPFKPQATER